MFGKPRFALTNPAPLTAYPRVTGNPAEPGIRHRATGSCRPTSVVEPAVTR